MSILIKGMEMPKNCVECPCYYDGYCHGMQYREEDEDYRAVSYREYDKKRRDDCPLIELPPHGDLIDRDNLAWMPIDITDLPLDECLPVYLKEDVDNAPAVVESEG